MTVGKGDARAWPACSARILAKARRYEHLWDLCSSISSSSCNSRPCRVYRVCCVAGFLHRSRSDQCLDLLRSAMLSFLPASCGHSTTAANGKSHHTAHMSLLRCGQILRASSPWRGHLLDRLSVATRILPERMQIRAAAAAAKEAKIDSQASAKVQQLSLLSSKSLACTTRLLVQSFDVSS